MQKSSRLLRFAVSFFATGILSSSALAARPEVEVQPANFASVGNNNYSRFVDQILLTWPATPQKVAKMLIKKYGLPQSAASTMLTWRNNGMWRKTIIYKEEIPHLFPKAHTDFLQQFIDFRVLPEMFSSLAQFDGSVIAERTKGELSARCDREEFNILAINLAVDVAMGKKTVEAARLAFVDNVKEVMAGKTPAYTQSFQFQLPRTPTQDPDASAIESQVQ